jgi:hypothetical protein
MTNQADIHHEALIAALKAAAICHTPSQGDAVAALVRAATEILSERFSPGEIYAMFEDWIGEGVALTQPAGRA